MSQSSFLIVAQPDNRRLSPGDFGPEFNGTQISVPIRLYVILQNAEALDKDRFAALLKEDPVRLIAELGWDTTSLKVAEEKLTVFFQALATAPPLPPSSQPVPNSPVAAGDDVDGQW